MTLESNLLAEAALGVIAHRNLSSASNWTLSLSFGYLDQSAQPVALLAGVALHRRLLESNGGVARARARVRGEGEGEE